MCEEELQYAISQYVDGVLPADQAAALEERFATDAIARQLLAEYRRMDALMDVALPMPEVDWDRMAGKISAAVDQSGFAPGMLPVAEEVPVYRMSWVGLWKPVALAASLLVCATVAVVLVRQPAQSPVSTPAVAVNPTPASPVRVAEAATPEEIRVLVAEKPLGDALAEVQIGPSMVAKSQDVAEYYPDLAGSRPASVSIAGNPQTSTRDEDNGVLQ